MKEIKLYNRDGANLKLVQTEDPTLWELEVDKRHQYIFMYMRIILYQDAESINDSNNWMAIDPSGGPMITVGDIFENKYEVVGFKDSRTVIISENEGNSNKEEHTQRE